MVDRVKNGRQYISFESLVGTHESLGEINVCPLLPMQVPSLGHIVLSHRIEKFKLKAPA